ncbi:peptidase S53 [Alicyclobacillaceae bacterium I2511]|nr:peptidase S53 [Alicyclobacillaceae bacterium I2511]
MTVNAANMWGEMFMRGLKISGKLALMAVMMGAVLPALATSAQADTTLNQGMGPVGTQNVAVFGNTPVDTAVTVSIILKIRNQNQLEQYIRDTTTPASAQFHNFLSTSQFAQNYGPPDGTIEAIVQYFQGYGITAQVDSNHLDITLNGTAGQFNQAFRVQLLNMGYKGKQFHAPKGTPQVPDSVAGNILAVLGLNNYSPFASDAQRLPQFVLNKLQNGGNSNTPPGGVVTPQQFAAHYQISPLYQQGDLGQGQTLGIVTLASLVPTDPVAFWHGYGIPASPNRVSLINVDGGAGAPSAATGSSETALDVEQSGAVAPGAKIVVYQAPNTDYGFVDAFFQAVSDNQVGSLSASWGESESAIDYFVANGEESPGYAQAFNEAFMEAAAQGISTFVSSGDTGAYAAFADMGTTNLSVLNPADSPYVTAVGGTTLPWSDVAGNFGNTILGIPNTVVTKERAWGWDYLWPYTQNFGAPNETSLAESLIGGSGGGYSTLFSQPFYQNGISGIPRFNAVPYFTPTQDNTAWNFNPTPQGVSGTSNGGRGLPDLSLNADPFTGYDIYSQVFGSTPWSAGWGGTSFGAPQFNGIAALVNQQAGGRVGFWNPQIYHFAQQDNSPFTSMNTDGISNDNLYYTGTPGAIWNPATGLGYPDGVMLAQDFQHEHGVI